MQQPHLRKGLATSSSTHNTGIKKLCAALGLATASLISAPALAAGGTGAVVLIHTGDIHGHLLPRPNLRSDADDNSLEGGVAPSLGRARHRAIRAPALIERGDRLW